MSDILEERREVLVVDDSEADIALFERILSARDPDAIVHSASSSEQVELILNSNSPKSAFDLVIIDVNMPKGGGMAILRKLKSDRDLRCIPVIVFSGSESEYDVKRAYELGANSYLVKPVDFSEFSKVVEFIDSYWLRGVSQLPKRLDARTDAPD